MGAGDRAHRIVEEQAALRRVAMLVARGVAPDEVFNAVAVELGRLLEASFTSIIRNDHGGAVTVVGAWSAPESAEPVPHVGTHETPPGWGSLTGLIRDTGRPGRIDYQKTTGDWAERVRTMGITEAVGVPITVEGQAWGAAVVASTMAAPLPESTEDRICAFIEIVSTAIANAESRSELAASRARLVEAGDEARRRIERDLHDGAQQRLLRLQLDLRLAEAELPPEQTTAKKRLSRAIGELSLALDELREISRGIHPAVLSRGGIGPALTMLSRRSVVPVELSLPGRRLPPRVETTVYYVASEALTNAAKHAKATAVRVELTVEEDAARLRIQDDGTGGADPARGSGLIGLRDRVEAMGGVMTVTSPPGEGTNVQVRIPIDR